MDLAKILETVMLVCFGAAWPLAIYKSWKTRTAKGKSICFLFVILIGYVAGIWKVVLMNGKTSLLLLPYLLNFVMVSVEILFYFRNSALDREAESAGGLK